MNDKTKKALIELLNANIDELQYYMNALMSEQAQAIDVINDIANKIEPIKEKLNAYKEISAWMNVPVFTTTSTNEDDYLNSLF